MSEDRRHYIVQYDVMVLLRKLVAIAERHVPSPNDYNGVQYCNSCGQTYPCPDRRTLDG